MFYKTWNPIIVSAALSLSLSLAAGGETHTNLQAVTATGASAWMGSYPFTVRGVILNNPEAMLDSTWDAGAESGNRMGAQWQIFIQAVDTGDRGGTACWMGQNYSSLGPWIPSGNLYSEAEWSNEMSRLNVDTNSLHVLRQGDLVEITARKSAFFGGKLNINETHRVTESNNFDIVLVQAGYGLPEPEVLQLADLVNQDDGDSGTHEDLFDATRQTGGESVQGMLVRLESIRIATNYYGANGWGQTNWADRLCTVTDGDGRFFTLRMPLRDVGSVPSGWFSAVGILNQESGSSSDGTFAYELFVQEIGPTLNMVARGDKMLVYWSGTYTNYVLETTTDLGGTSGWQQVTAPPVRLIAVEQAPAEFGGATPVYRLRQLP